MSHITSQPATHLQIFTIYKLPNEILVKKNITKINTKVSGVTSS